MFDFILLTGWLVFSITSLLTVLFLYTSLIERKYKAFGKGIIFFMPLLLLLFSVLLIDFPFKFYLLGGAFLLAGIGMLLLVLPFHKTWQLLETDGQLRIDERDAIFHRFYRLQEGTPEFEKYYREHPEKYEFDEKVRSLPNLGSPRSKAYSPLTSPFQIATFSVLEDITREIEWQPCRLDENFRIESTDNLTGRIKGFVRYLGADFVGATKLNPVHAYSHIGRSPGKWGAPIELNHSHAFVIGVEMDYRMVQQAPESATTTETAFKYFEAAKAAMIVAKYLNLLGYEARAHVDGNYRVLCVPIAVDAGLGELSRMGLLIHPKFGARVRLAVVTTNAPLQQDAPVAFGVQHFCSICRKCALLCPSAAIDGGEKQIHNGVEKWQSSQEKCYRFWRLQGTDCSICVKVCPYSYPDSPLHNMIRWLTRRNNFARRIALLGDEFFYGRERQAHVPPPDWHRSQEVTSS